MSRGKEALVWAVQTFGRVAADPRERAMRFLEEALELSQAEGVGRGDVLKIADRVYERPLGHTPKEVGQAMLTLETLAFNLGIDADNESRRELERIRSIPQEEWTRRHAAKTAAGITTSSK